MKSSSSTVKPTSRPATAQPSGITTLDKVVGLPILWTFTILFLAMVIPPVSFETALRSLYIDNPSKEGRSVLILTAHPDDEAMFFSPTILGLKNAGWKVNGLCLSSGNSEGLGMVREQELYKSWGVLGVPTEQVSMVHDSELQDGMLWDANKVKSVVDNYIEKHPVEMVITFDSEGVSSHPNHVALSKYRPALPTPETTPIKLYHLKSPSIVTKYTGALNPIARRAWYQLKKGMDDWAEVFDFKNPIQYDITLVSSGLDWIVSIRAMLKHGSQMVWFRYGWLAASSLMWANDLKFIQ